MVIGQHPKTNEALTSFGYRSHVRHDRRGPWRPEDTRSRPEEKSVEPVFAYLDAASGSMIIQAVIAALVAGPILLRNKIGAGARFVRAAVSRDRQEPHPSDTHRR